MPYEHGRGRFANNDGRILPGLYCVGWARRGPTGTIGTNRPDGYAIADLVAEDIGDGAGKQGPRRDLTRLLKERGTDVVTFRGLEEYRESRKPGAPRDGSPREKFTAIEDMIRARG